MEVTFKGESKDKDCHRTVYNCAISYVEKKTPSRHDLVTAVAKKAKADPTCVVVRSLSQPFGEQNSEFVACVYDNVDALEKFEVQSVTKKSKLPEKKKEEPKAEEAPAAPAEEATPEAAEEKPAEEKAE